MKLTKKLEAEILKLYNKYWAAYLNGKMRIMSSLMDKNCHVIGSGMGEVFKNKKDAVKYYTATADQIAGVSEMRNRNISVAPAGNNILVTEESDFYVLMEGSWSFYGQGRFSTLFGKTEKKWLIIQQHGSLPDSRTGGGEQLNTDKIKEENLRLKEAIKRRTIELENKNRELEIEASLERVRAVAMSMNKSEDLLSICEIFFKEFKKLGFDDLRNSLINIFNDEEESFVNYDYSDYMGGSISNVSYNSNPANDEFLIKIKKANDAFVETVIDRNKLDEWKEFRRSHGEQDDPRLDNVNALYYYNYSIGSGSIGISNFNPISEEQQLILKRFRNVFNLSYQRYLDIALAEEQAREAQVELALERVRARTMAMQKSEELKEVIQLVYEQFVHLNIHIEHTGFIMDYKARDDMHIWLADKHEVPSEVTIPYFDCAHWNSFNEAKEKGIDFFANHLTLEEKNRFYKDLFKLIPDVPEETLEYYFGCPGLAISTVLLEDVGLYIENFSGIPYSDEENNTLMRFGKVFQQTYTRFNDLKQAEAQAREAQIEAALEKVRSRSLAMHKSDELADLSFELVKQVQALGVSTWFCAFNIYDDDQKGSLEWGSNAEGTYPNYRTPREGIFLRYYEAGQSGETLLINEIGENECAAHYEYLCSLPGVGEQLLKMKDSGISFPDSQIDHVAYFKYGYIIFITFVPATEAHDIFKRFAKVFEQTYTRFLDLQKAEDQAREAQIETALEKVRSRTMAMHKSDELSETAEVLFEQINLLGKIPDRMSIGIINEESKNVEFWVTDQGGHQLSHEFFFSLDEPTSIDKIYNAWKERKDSFVVDLTGQNLQDWLQFVKENAKLPIDETKIKGRRVQQAAFFSQGFLFLTSHEPVANETMTLLVRFAKVFEQTYTRFLDLQNAEEQAREAQIEAALERVRSKAMAMHSSEDLATTVDTFFSELNALEVTPHRCGVGIVDAETRTTDIHANTTTHDNEIKKVAGKLKLSGHPVLDSIFENWKLQKEYHPVLHGNEIVDYYKVMDPQVKFPDFADDETQYGYYFYFKEGGVFAWTDNELTERDLQIFRRYTSVLSLTYRRYMDLKEAEAQAREAQIEAALERVRSKTMAMHNSHDVGVTVVTLFDEVLELGLDNSIRCGIGILEGTESMETWSATSYPNGEVDLKMGMLDMTIHPMLIGLKKAWESGEKSYGYEYSRNDLIKYYSALNNESEYPFHIELDTLPEKEFHNSFFFSEGILFAFTSNPVSEEAAKVLNRFAGVFGQTYRRYLDLQKAEAQTREAQIEAALERVRSKATAMHNSEDLSATVNVFFKELKKLGIAPIRCGVGQIDEETRTTSLTTTTSSQQGDSFEVIGKIKQTGHPVLDGIYEHWELQKEYHPVLQGDDIKAYYSVMKPQMAFPDYPEDATQYGNLFYFKEGFVFAWTESKLIEDELQIFRRFTSVLSLTYRRYMDLKEAEARAREAEQQASLDRVRAEIASMRTTDDLEKITPLIWRELTTLGVPFFRCGVFIIDEPNSVAHAYLSTPLGKSLAALHVKIDNTWLENAVKHWHNGEIYHEVWDRNRFVAWTQNMIEQGFVENKEHFQAGKEAPENLSLQLLPFTQGMLYVGSKLPLSNEEIKIAEKLADDFGVAYSRYEDFQKLEAVNHRKTLELEEARQLQLSMLPKELPKLPNLDIAVYMKTATEVGGDYYDFNVGVDETLTVAIGDATGHGMKAGTIVSMIKALFASSGSKMDMKTYFKQSSDALKGIELGRLMMAFLMLRINSHKLLFANAAMPPLYIYKKQSKDVEEIIISGMPLGAIKDFPYQIREMEISSGDTILLLSDGLPELKNGKDEHYGYNRVKDEFKSVAEKRPDDIVSFLKNSAADWVNGVEPDDDVTFVVIKVK